MKIEASRLSELDKFKLQKYKNLLESDFNNPEAEKLGLYFLVQDIDVQLVNYI